MRFLCALDYRCHTVDFLLQVAEEIESEVVLSRSEGSLGFNIMGGSEV